MAYGMSNWEGIDYGWADPKVRDVWYEDGYWWARNTLEDDSFGPFDSMDDAIGAFKELN